MTAIMVPINLDILYIASLPSMVSIF